MTEVGGQGLFLCSVSMTSTRELRECTSLSSVWKAFRVTPPNVDVDTAEVVDVDDVVLDDVVGGVVTTPVRSAFSTCSFLDLGNIHPGRLESSKPFKLGLNLPPRFVSICSIAGVMVPNTAIALSE